MLGVLVWPAAVHASGVIAYNALDCSLPMEGSSPNPCPSTIWLAAEDGSGAVRVTDGSAPGEPTWGGDWEPAWSPDGRSLVFPRTTLMPDLRWSGSPTPYRGLVLWVSSADGSQQRQLVSPADSERIPNQRKPVWTADGRRIVFSGDVAVHSVAADGTDLRQISPEGEPALFASATPDGRVTYLTQRFFVPGSQAP